MKMILRILFILAKGFLLWVLLQPVTYWLTPGSPGRLSLRKVFALSLYLNLPLTYSLTGGDEIVDKLYLVSSHDNPLDAAPLAARR